MYTSATLEVWKTPTQNSMHILYYKAFTAVR